MEETNILSWQFKDKIIFKILFIFRSFNEALAQLKDV